jgi:EmrB/QacA subfamily drug resistance transporter
MQYKWVVLTVTTIGIFMSSLDASIIVVGLKVVMNDLNTNLAAGVWIITSYRLATTVLLLSIGRFADMIGRVKLYNIGFLVFTIGSGLCAVAPDATTLVTFRLLQGVGSALLFVNSMAIVTDAFPPDELGTGISINQVAINAGNIVGYTLSGIMISLFSWRSLFVVNLPIGAFGAYWAHRRLKELPRKEIGQKFDGAGAAAFSTGLTILLLAMTVGDIRSVFTQVAILLGVLMLSLFFYIERRVGHPLIDPRLFRIRAFAVGNFTNLLNGITFGGLAFVIALYYQVVRGLLPEQAGLALIPLDIALLFIGPVSGRLSDKFGARWLSAIGLAISGASFLLFASLDLTTPELMVVEALAVAGLGIGFFRSPNASSVMGSVPAERRGIAAGVRSTIINTSLVISIPLATLLMTFVLPYQTLSAIIAGGQPNSADLSLFVAAIRYVFLVFAFVNFFGALISPLRGSFKKPDAPALDV